MLHERLAVLRRERLPVEGNIAMESCAFLFGNKHNEDEIRKADLKSHKEYEMHSIRNETKRVLVSWLR